MDLNDVLCAAARSLGQLKPDGVIQIVQELADDKAPGKIVDRLVAANMIASSRDESALQVIIELAVDPEPAGVSHPRP